MISYDNRSKDQEPIVVIVGKFCAQRFELESHCKRD